MSAGYTIRPQGFIVDRQSAASVGPIQFPSTRSVPLAAAMTPAAAAVPTFAPLLTNPGAVYIPPSPVGTIVAKRFRTKLCENFQRDGCCPFGDSCMFAHGQSKLRSTNRNLREGLTTELAIKQFQEREAIEKEQLSGGGMTTTARFLSDEAPASPTATSTANGIRPQSLKSFNPVSASESRSVLVADLSRPQPLLGSDNAGSGFRCGVLSRSDSSCSSTSLRETGGVNTYVLSPAPSNASGGDYQPALPPSYSPSLTETVAAMAHRSSTPEKDSAKPTKINSPTAAKELGTSTRRRSASSLTLTIDMKDGSYRRDPYGWGLAVQAASYF